MKVNIKRLNENAIIPTRGSNQAAGYDLYACVDAPVNIHAHCTEKIPTGLAIEIPMLSTEKEMFYNADLLKGLVYSSYDSLGDTIDVKAKSEPYEIFKIPNNLDKFNEKFGYYSMIDGIGGSGFHSGIEFAILPDAYNYRGNVDVFDALYCFYFIVEDNQVRSIELINYLDEKYADIDVLGYQKLDEKIRDYYFATPWDYFYHIIVFYEDDDFKFDSLKDIMYSLLTTEYD